MWEVKDNALERTFVFNNFIEAFAFMTKVAIISEKYNHHPTWLNTWNKVTIRLSTHDAGNIITTKDEELASSIDKLFNIN
jgi:4a-hydroxytetrahydrobiopterin dehydratase